MSNRDLKILMSIQKDLLKLNGRDLSEFHLRRNDFQEQVALCLNMVSQWIRNEEEMIKHFGPDE